MEANPFWIVPLLAVVTAAVLTPVVRRWSLARNLVDLPGERRSHDQPTPRGGGLAVIAAMVVASLVGADAWWAALALLCLLGLLGWLDDARELSPMVRLAAQAAAAVVAVWLVGGIDSVDILGRSLNLPWLWTVLAGVAFVWLVNLHNFMDGSDGLAAMQGAWSGVVMGCLLGYHGLDQPALFALAMGGAFAGFLLWNWPPARVFMGDVGSMALGAGFALIALVGAATGTVSVWVSFIVASVFVVDATATLVARVRRGERWYTAHRQHAYQRLILKGWSHARVLVLYAAVNLVLVLPVAVLATANPRLEAVLAAGLTVLLAGGWWVIQSATTTENQRHG